MSKRLHEGRDAILKCSLFKSRISDGLDLHKPDVSSKPAGILNAAHIC